MPVYFCYRPKGSCSKCEYYRYDPERNDKACFAKHDVERRSLNEIQMEKRRK
jgi:hypothetical protein